MIPRYVTSGINVTTACLKMVDSGSARERCDARRDYNSAARGRAGFIKTRSAIHQCHLYTVISMSTSFWFYLPRAKKRRRTRAAMRDSMLGRLRSSAHADPLRDAAAS